jgi:hypothetical protein
VLAERSLDLANEDFAMLDRVRDGTPAELEPAVALLLARLDEDFAQRLERFIVTMSAALLDRTAMLTQGTEVYLDTEIEGASHSSNA